MPLKNFAHHKVVKPPNNLIEAYDLFCVSIREKIEFNEMLIVNYSDLPDTLLPRLISGQPRLPEAEAEIEALTD